MTVITETLLRADGSPARGRVFVTLAGDGGQPTIGYADDGTRVAYAGTHTDDDGRWELDLTPNNEIIPAGTVYRITLSGDGLSPTARYITVPDAGPVTVDEILTDPPGALTPPAVAALAARVDDLTDRLEHLEDTAVQWTPQEES